jgi:hypothetical protein
LQERAHFIVGSLASRENELGRLALSSASLKSEVSTIGQIDQLKAADAANQRIMDQLNSQVQCDSCQVKPRIFINFILRTYSRLIS